MNEKENDQIRQLLGEVIVTKEPLDFSNCQTTIKTILEPCTPQLLEVATAYSYLNPLPETSLRINNNFFETSFRLKNHQMSIEIRDPYIPKDGVYISLQLEGAKVLRFTYREDYGLIYTSRDEMVKDTEFKHQLTPLNIANQLEISLDIVYRLLRFFNATRALVRAFRRAIMSRTNYHGGPLSFHPNDPFYKGGILTLSDISIFFHDKNNISKLFLVHQTQMKTRDGIPYDLIDVNVKIQ